jgi:hypothetical protein
VPPIHVALKTQGGNPASVDVVDESGHLTAAVSGTVPEIVNDASFHATNDTPTKVRLAWPGSPCDTVHRLTIDADLGRMTLDRPRCFGDAMAAFRELVLTFDQPVDAASLEMIIQDGRGGVDMPTWTASAPDSTGAVYHLTVEDPAQVVTALSGSYDPDVDATGAGPTGIQIVRGFGETLRLIWRGPACATSPALSIDPSGGRWRLTNAPCTAARDVLRMVEIDMLVPTDPLPTVEAVTVVR